MNNILRLFHKKTNFNKESQLPPPVEWPDSWKVTKYRSKVSSDDVIRLPKLNVIPDTSLVKAILNRKSDRSFGDEGLDINTISSLLYYTCGMLFPMEGSSENVEKRGYPSAGARYPIEVYPVIKDIADIPTGIYHYNVQSHSLELVRPVEYVSEVRDSYKGNVSWAKEAKVIFLFSVVFERMLEKYGDRGYRYMLQESGALAQNMYLVGTVLNLNVCAVAGYEDETINEILDLDGVQESMALSIVCGGGSNERESKYR